jgi:hypothetical protein
MKSPRISNEELDNFRTFKDLLSGPLLEGSVFENSKGTVSRSNTQSSRKAVRAGSTGSVVEKNESSDRDIDNAAEELAEFIDVILTSFQIVGPIYVLTYRTSTSPSKHSPLCRQIYES